MKSAGRALEIVTVGLGQAGGNLAAEFYRRGYPALALNTASTDLSSLQGGVALPEEHRMYIGLEGHDGAGSDVGYGRDCISSNADKICERINEHAAGADLVLITCGLGGGTGSAVAELIGVLEELSLPLLVLATLPNDHESGIVKVNAVKAVNDLVKQNLLGWVFVDNSRLAQAHSDLPINRFWAEVNKVIADPLDALNLLNEREGVTPIRTLDGEDLRTLLLSGGLLTFGSKELSKLTGEGVLEAVHEIVQYSRIMPEGFSLENVSYLGLVLEAPESLLSTMPFSLFEQISEQLKGETGGAAVYLGVYRNDGAQAATVRLLCSSQTLPDGIQEMVGAAKREGAQLRDKLQQTLTGLDLGEIEEYELFRTSPGAIRRRITEPPKRSPRTSKRAGPPATSSNSVKSAEPTPARDAARTPASSTPANSTSPAPSGGAAPPPLPTSTSADREAYDEMVREFKSSGSEQRRTEITQRLEADRQSDNSLVRYYAVRAMTKLDTELFADALQAATQDEDATVRAIATKALQQRA